MKTIRLANPVLLLYLLYTYIGPAALNFLTGYESEIYLNPSNGVFSWLYAVLLLGIVGAFAFDFEFLTIGPRSLPRVLPSAWNLPAPALIVFLSIVLGVGITGAALGLARWRYSGEALSSSLDLTTLLYVLAPNFVEMLLFILIFFRYVVRPFSVRVILVLVIACLSLTATGIGPMVSVLLACVAFLAPDTLRRWLFRVSDGASVAVFEGITVRKLLFAAVTVILGAGAYVIGDAIKRDVAPLDVIAEMEAGGKGAFAEYLIGRLSVHWYSLVVAVHEFVDVDVGGQFDHLMAPLGNAWFRFSTLTGGWMPSERPLNGSLGRLNYNLINRYPLSEREGSSPGLIASFLIAFPVWLAPFALTAYLAVYNGIQKRLRLRMAGRLSWVGESVLLEFTSIFFDSPVDFLLIFDPMVVTAIGWVALGYSSREAAPDVRRDAEDVERLRAKVV